VIPVSSLNRDRYVTEILEVAKKDLVGLSKRGFTFQQDNATPHSNTKAWLRRRKIRALESWPAVSCDLSVIETVWSWVQHAVATKGPYGVEELAAFAQEIWDGFSQAQIDNLVDSFWERCTDCIAAGGKTIKPRRRWHPRA
jgi:hypothetical protein